MRWAPTRHIVLGTQMLLLRRWATGVWPSFEREGRQPAAPAEAVALRCFALLFLLACVVVTCTTRPHPSLHGRGLIVLGAIVLLTASAVAAQPRRPNAQPWRLVLALAGVTVASIALAIVQPQGIWEAGPTYVAIVAALRLDLRAGLLLSGVALAPFVIASASEGHVRAAALLGFSVAPWFLVMRFLRAIHAQREELDASRAAAAEAAAAAERGRLAREMHDVLAHSLSALALQLESTRLIAREQHVPAQLSQAIEKAHHLAAGGLQEARRAIATARGDELPGPERIGSLADAFGEQSGLPVEVKVHGQPRELAPEARLAVYRTTQEALTNVRRHATAQRVEVKLDYRPGSTVLVVEDHARAESPPPADLSVTGSGYGLTGMRERAELLGGELLAAPMPRGFRVELRLPA